MQEEAKAKAKVAEATKETFICTGYKAMRREESQKEVKQDKEQARKEKERKR